MYILENEFIKLGAVEASVKSTVTRVDFRTQKGTVQIVISAMGVMCAHKETGEPHIIPTKYINAIIDVLDFYVNGRTEI